MLTVLNIGWAIKWSCSWKLRSIEYMGIISNTSKALTGRGNWPTTLSSIGRKLLLNMACIVYTLVQTKRELLSDRSRQRSICFKVSYAEDVMQSRPLWAPARMELLQLDPHCPYQSTKPIPMLFGRVLVVYLQCVKLSPAVYTFIYSYLNFALRIIHYTVQNSVFVTIWVNCWTQS